jgi:hypothetical protein
MPKSTKDEATPAEGSQHACGMTCTKVKSYPNPRTEKRALEFLVYTYRCRVYGRTTPMSRLERDLIDDLYHMIRYGLAQYYPRKQTFGLFGPPLGSEERRLRTELMNAQTIPDDPSPEGND